MTKAERPVSKHFPLVTFFQSLTTVGFSAVSYRVTSTLNYFLFSLRVQDGGVQLYVENQSGTRILNTYKMIVMTIITGVQLHVQLQYLMHMYHNWITH